MTIALEHLWQAHACIPTGELAERAALHRYPAGKHRHCFKDRNNNKIEPVKLRYDRQFYMNDITNITARPVRLTFAVTPFQYVF